MFTLVHGRELRISHYDKTRLKQDQANLFVKNLSPDETNKSFYSIFKPFGEIFSSMLAQDYKGKSKGYGFVQYTSPIIATRVVQEMNGKDHHEKKLIVECYKRKELRVVNNLYNNLYVKNLPPSINTKEELDSLFARFGERLSVILSQSELKGHTNYYGFVSFRKPEDAVKAAAEMNGKTIENTPLYVVKALTKEQREREKRKQWIEKREKARAMTLYIKSVSGAPLTEDLIRAQLEPYGKIDQVYVQRKKTSEGVEINLPIAFARFSNEEDLKLVTISTYIVGAGKIY